MNPEKLFSQLFEAGTEQDVEKLISTEKQIFKNENWEPLGKNQSNYGVIENQQSNPIAALIEKITNSIDAILTRKCLEAGLEPFSTLAPKSMEDAIGRYFENSSDWDLPSFRKQQSENLQIIADGPRKRSSLIIYDDGEGQHPESFEDTFLSLLRGNKNQIHFVQGKYNMGGSGAIVFCGKRGFQLIGSRKFDKSGDFGFTVIREHPLTEEEKKTKKNTWYEYLLIDGKIPTFKVEKPLELGLYNRKFETGTVIKLYSYDLPSGSRSVISRDLNQSINEYLFQPALPILTVDKKERYPDDRNLERPLYGLKRRLEQDDDKYVDHMFSETCNDELFGKNGFAKITCYVFKNKIDNKTAKETKETIRREFFKNNMSALFSVNGQVHGHYTSEFIVRSLQMNLLKHHLLIHVDCTNMDIDFRNKLFMASRDRLKDGEETRALRDFLSKRLKANDTLKDILKQRKQIGSYEQSDTKELLRSITKNLPLNDDIRKLLDNTLRLDHIKDDKEKENKTGQKERSGKNEKRGRDKFKPERFPTNFKVRIKERDGIRGVNIPRGSEKRIYFDTDVENNYFDRVDEPGELKIALVNVKRDGEKPIGPEPNPTEITEVFNVVSSSPKDGTIRVSMTPKQAVNVGDEMEVKITLTNPSGDFEELFWTKIAEPEQKKEKKEPKSKEDDLAGIPPMEIVYENREGFMTWDEVATLTSDDFNHGTVMYPLAEGERELERVFINMDSNVYKSFMSKYKNPNDKQLIMAENKYKSSVYLHTLFLYAITKNRGFTISKKVEGKNEDEPIDIGEYLKDVFDHYYSAFILNYGGMEEMMVGVGD